MVRVLVVGQIPPPWGGQAVMIQKLLEGKYSRIKMYHVRMAFSRDMGEIGDVRVRKVVHLFSVIARVYWARIWYRPSVLYYPPAGPQRAPVLRDIVILIATRWMFARTVFHFHAGGVSELIGKLNWLERWLAKRAYRWADCAIRPSALNPPDGVLLGAKRNIVIPHGLEDHYPGLSVEARSGQVPRILYVGVLRVTKGLMVLIEACKLLKESGLRFQLDLMGQFYNSGFERQVKEAVSRWGLENSVCFLGVKSGDAKWCVYAITDILCFPSFFESESFGLVVLEAMRCSIPVVATRWRGIGSVVRDGDTGFLVPPRDSEALAERLARLLKDPDERKTMGHRGREVFLQEYQIDRWRGAMEDVLAETR